MRLSRSDDHGLSAIQPIGKDPPGSPPPAAGALGSNDPWPGGSRTAARAQSKGTARRMASATVIDPTADEADDEQDEEEAPEDDDVEDGGEE